MTDVTIRGDERIAAKKRTLKTRACFVFLFQPSRFKSSNARRRINPVATRHCSSR
jgi:hypothetical protein